MNKIGVNDRENKDAPTISNVQSGSSAATAPSAGSTDIGAASASPQPEARAPPQHAAGSSPKFDLQKLLDNRYAFLAIFLVIIIIAVFMRVGMLKYQGLFEPDGFYFYTAVENAVAHHFIVQDYSPLSGFPWHNARGEEPGTTWFSVAGYFLLRGFGVSILQVMRFMPVLFGVLEVIVIYFVAKYLVDSRGIGLLAALFLAISSGNIARTAALVYRGDSFISLFAIVTILFMLMALKEERRRRQYIYAALSGIVLSFGIMVWSGSPYVVATYFLAVVLLLLYGFVVGDEKVMHNSLVLALALGFAFLLEHAYIFAHLAYGGITLSGIGFVGLYVPLLAGDIIFIALLKRKLRPLATPLSRLVLFVVLALIVIVGVDATIGSAFNGIISGGGFSVPTNVLNNPNASKSAVIGTAIGVTTEELQRPSLAFLFGSFNIQLFFAPLGALLFLLVGVKLSKGREFGLGNGKLKLGLNEPFLVLIAYFFVTGYLQSGAVRWNSLVSLPIALFAAYAVYVLYRLTKGVHITSGRVLAAFVILFDLLIIYFSITQVSPAMRAPNINIIMVSAIIVNLILAYIIIEGIRGAARRRLDLNKVYVGFIFALLIFNIYMTGYQSYTAAQADGINPLFLQAMAWMKNNTPSNATVLTLWPDGSVVEAWANRTSYMDSVAGENGTRIYYFSRFLFNTSDDPQYLYSIGKPDYLVARTFWFDEIGGIAQEGLVQNSTQYGIDILTSASITHGANNSVLYTFGSNTPPYYGAKVFIEPLKNGSSLAAGYINVNNGPYYEIKHVLFYNSNSYAYSLFNSSVSNTLNFTLMISYANSSITGAEILGPKLLYSNIFKFTTLCGYTECPYDNSMVSLKLVYANSDTRIFKILYNTSYSNLSASAHG